VFGWEKPPGAQDEQRCKEARAIPTGGNPQEEKLKSEKGGRKIVTGIHGLVFSPMGRKKGGDIERRFGRNFRV